jgi:hypothetical protein
VSKKDPQWSYKLNAPGVRFQAVIDCQRRVRRLWGPYSPKIEDTTFLQMYHREIENDFDGANVLGDGHYYEATRTFNKAHFYAPRPEPKQPRGVARQRGQGLVVLTKTQQQNNLEIRRLRADMESPFGDLHKKLDILSTPFAEGFDQLGYVVVFAVGLHNRGIRH